MNSCVSSLFPGLNTNEHAQGDSIMLEDDSFFHYIVSSLAMLMLDPFYRTIAGFRTLIDHVWRHSNFPFSKATGIGSPVKTQSFVHFLDCVWQIWHQMPSEFEISEDLLVFLGRNLSSGRYGTFLGMFWDASWSMRSESGALHC